MNKLIAIAILCAAVLGLPTVWFNCWEDLDASEIMVIQAPFSGKLTWHITPGTKWQGWGAVTKYPRRTQLWFSAKPVQGRTTDESLQIRFNDGAKATISGSLSYEMPMDEVKLTDIHMKFHNAQSLEQQMIFPTLEKSVYMTGPLLSSAESYASRRNELLKLIDDQFITGVYKTKSRDERTIDPVTGQSKTVKVVEIMLDAKTNEPERQDVSPLQLFGIQIFGLAINEITYDANVEIQIQEQQKSIMAVQTSLATTKMAEQKGLTAEAEGKAAATEAEWKQKVIAAQATAEADQLKQVAITKATQEKEVALTAAQQALEVAQLQTQAAEQEKLAAILKGEGEAMARKLVMDADGSLDHKLQAWVQVNSEYARAIGEHRGAWVPSVVMGASSTTNGTGSQAATDLISLLSVKTAKDLGLSTEIPEKSGTLPDIKRPEMPTFKFTPSPVGGAPPPAPRLTAPAVTGTK